MGWLPLQLYYHVVLCIIILGKRQHARPGNISKNTDWNVLLLYSSVSAFDSVSNVIGVNSVSTVSIVCSVNTVSTEPSKG